MVSILFGMAESTLRTAEKAVTKPRKNREAVAAAAASVDETHETCKIGDVSPTESLSTLRNTIVLGDALTVLPTLQGEPIHLSVFSPPYDGIRDYGKDWVLDYHTLGSELFQVTTPGGVCAVVIGDGTKDFAKSLTTFRWAVDWVDRAGWRGIAA